MSTYLYVAVCVKGTPTHGATWWEPAELGRRLTPGGHHLKHKSHTVSILSQHTVTTCVLTVTTSDGM